jgi:hypothetical protein
MNSPTTLADAALPPGSAQPFLDVVDFVERTTYAIWNDRRPELVSSYYGRGASSAATAATWSAVTS